MPYQKREDLPDSVKHVLPAHAQDIYKEAFNSAWQEYKDKKNGGVMNQENKLLIR